MWPEIKPGKNLMIKTFNQKIILQDILKKGLWLVKTHSSAAESSTKAGF